MHTMLSPLVYSCPCPSTHHLVLQVLLFAERNKLPGLKRLLEAGGAHVLNKITIPGLKDVTHAFINISYFPKESVSEERLFFVKGSMGHGHMYRSI